MMDQEYINMKIHEKLEILETTHGHDASEAAIETVWHDFWEPLVTNHHGIINKHQLKKELYDFFIMLDEVPKVYMEVTNGHISKPNTKAYEVIQEYEEYMNKLIVEALEDERNNN